MASWTDTNIPQFNPYVQQLPVEAMVQVGMHKQKQYEEGIQKIQTNIDNVAGLDVMRDVDKVYLQSKLNELGNNLKTVAAGDFSNFQLVNSVNGMTTQIVKDKNVQTAVSSTAKARKELSLMEEDRKAGKLTPDNEYFFNKKLNNWYSGSELGTSFNDSYVQHFDVFKFSKETFDAVKPDGYSYDQIYQLDGNGRPMHDKKGNLIYSPTMTRMEKEGIFPEKVKETLSQIFSDPRVGQQLNITGQYNYRSLDSEQLAQKISTQKESVLGNYENELNDLTLQKNMGKDVQQKIDNLFSKMKTVSSAYDEYIDLAFSDSEAIRGALYKEDVTSRYTTMFGQIKDKSQVMENPNWNQNFKMQQEANEQSRFAQTLRQQKIAHADDLQYKYDALAQQKELTKLTLSVKSGKKTLGGEEDNGVGPGGEPSEQASQSAAIDVIRLQATKFDEAATDYTNTSESFIWETVLSKIPSNDVKLNKLISQGVSRDKAVSILIDNAAKAAGVSPADFKTTWSTKAISSYNKLSPEEKAARPIIGDTYNKFKASKRIFDNELTVKKRIDERTKVELGEIGKKIDVADLKPQTIIYKDKQYTIDKADMLDLAIYQKGNLGFLESILGGDETKTLETESKLALARLTQRGKGALVEAYENDNANVIKGSDGKRTKYVGGIGESLRSLTNLPNALRFSSERSPNRNWSQVHQAYDIMDNHEYNEGIKKKAEIIQQGYGIAPNRNIGILTGDLETDRGTLAKLKRWGAEYTSLNGNMSPDFKDFTSSLSDNPSENNLGARTIMDGNNKPMVEVISYDKNGERVGGITIQPDQARKLDIDLGTLYESKETSALRNKLNFNNYQTSAGDPSELSTYINGDSYYDKNDFPALRNSKKFDVQANIQFINDKYYPFIYASDGKTKTVKQLDGDENLENLIISLKNINPLLVQKLLIMPNQ